MLGDDGLDSSARLLVDVGRLIDYARDRLLRDLGEACDVGDSEFGTAFNAARARRLAGGFPGATHGTAGSFNAAAHRPVFIAAPVGRAAIFAQFAIPVTILI